MSTGPNEDIKKSIRYPMLPLKYSMWCRKVVKSVVKCIFRTVMKNSELDVVLPVEN